MRGSKHNMDRREWQSTGARLYAKHGTELPQAKADEAVVARIRRLHARKQRLIERLNRDYSAAGLARRFGLHVRTVEKMLRRESWAHVR
ncbi:hypothetical protein HA052_24595 [Chromobacterium haemolyticum]|uniref:Uncharacterized protein n=2 Tax=Chromobacterium TaxID=535 RepID=A0ABX0LC73_9NEIS|nr:MULTISPECIES: hypothetical protein [Chromobacterium]NHR08375.1 hypothetical protein [Chromobacterium haemolyticum]